jgi:CBS-domain-containing membrane protein
MARSYIALPGHPLPPGTPAYHYLQGLPERVEVGDPAINVMTDLKRVRVITVEPEVNIDDALQKMIHAGVRLLIVTDPETNVTGVISARDIMGEKPVSYISRERVSRADITVADIMTPREELDALEMADVLKARVGDIVATLRERGRQHALVLDQSESSGRVVRGIFSVTQIGAQLGVEIQATGQVQSFAELEQMLMAS